MESVVSVKEETVEGPGHPLRKRARKGGLVALGGRENWEPDALSLWCNFAATASWLNNVT